MLCAAHMASSCPGGRACLIESRPWTSCASTPPTHPQTCYQACACSPSAGWPRQVPRSEHICRDTCSTSLCLFPAEADSTRSDHLVSSCVFACTGGQCVLEAPSMCVLAPICSQACSQSAGWLRQGSKHCHVPYCLLMHAGLFMGVTYCVVRLVALLPCTPRQPLCLMTALIPAPWSCLRRSLAEEVAASCRC